MSTHQPVMDQREGLKALHSQSALPLQTHPIHIRIPLLKPHRLIHRIGLHASRVRGEAEVDGSEFGAGEVDDGSELGIEVDGEADEVEVI